ncbi:MAG: inositol monophosphatase family protein [Candidatus Thermoplasmatota archaeon]|nr:inositol monophosphatase family protein [Candidatus Thermoplasmatota archaeon]
MNDIDTLCTIANEIRNVISVKFPNGGGGGVIRQGYGGDRTREIDQLAERTALEWLEEKEINWNILSEESGNIERGGDRTLIFDPVDGTYNAVNGIPLYSTSLALTIGPDNFMIGCGVVLDIPNGTCFKATRGKGAFMNGERIHTRNYMEKNTVFSSFIGPDSEEDSLKMLSWARRGRYFGAVSLEMCFVAKGALDLFALFSRVPRITDIAASHLILLEAGGTHIKIDISNKWSDYHLGEYKGVKSIISIGDRDAVDRIMEISGVNR